MQVTLVTRCILQVVLVLHAKQEKKPSTFNHFQVVFVIFLNLQKSISSQFRSVPTKVLESTYRIKSNTKI